MKYYLYNKLANNGVINPCLANMDEDSKIDVTAINVVDFLKTLKEDDEVVLVGGDGTINHFVNDTKDYEIHNKIYVLASGTGNDFLHDLNVENKNDLILLNDYLKNLPTVYVNDVKRQFINGVGYGIDGYCCEVADKMKANGKSKINYTGIAIKGLLFHFKPVQAIITVDGVTSQYNHVWLAPTMKGRYYGGGMMIAPNQNRQNDSVSVVVYHTKSKLKALMVFPSIFKGEHIKKEKMVKIVSGKEIEVIFNRPCALQIDGETILNVTSYKVIA